MTEEDIQKELEASLKKILELAEECLLPKLQSSLEEMSNKECEDYMKTRKLMVRENLDQIQTILNQITCASSNPNLTKLHRRLLVQFLILAGEQHDSTKPWTLNHDPLIKIANIIKRLNQNLITIDNDPTNTATTTITTRTVDEVFGGILTDDFKTESEILPRKSIFFLCLQSLRPKFTKETWKLFPASVTAFKWIISFIKYPHLSDFMNDVLQPSLLFTDDYNDEYKLDGINCLQHVIRNLNKADLVRDNWSGVLYSALMTLVNDKNPQVINEIVPLICSILKIIEADPHENSHIFTKYDQAMKKILFAIEFCSEQRLKPVWIHQLTSILEVLGHATLHWVDKICGILLDFTTTTDFILWMNILQCLQVITKNTWLKPVSSKSAEIILRIVLNIAALDFQEISDENKKELFRMAKENMNLLKFNSDYTSVSAQLDEMKQSKEFHPKFVHVIKDF